MDDTDYPQAPDNGAAERDLQEWWLYTYPQDLIRVLLVDERERINT
jgi:hypothetical protein